MKNIVQEQEFVALEPLDLRKCHTVGEIVDAMSRCAFGARMLGETCKTLSEWIKRQVKPLIIYDGKLDTPLGRLLKLWVQRCWSPAIVRPENFTADYGRGEKIIVVGGYSERYEENIYERSDRAIFINPYGLAKPGQVKDGYFPDVIFSDPRYVLPVLTVALEEELWGKPTTVTELLTRLTGYGGVATQVARGAKTLEFMVNDQECTVFLTVSGAMTIAQMSLVICEMIENEMVQSVTTTGALMAHGLIESVGLKHYKHHPAHDDAFLAGQKLNRVTDSLEPESNFDELEETLDKVFNTISGQHPLSPSVIHDLIGEYLGQEYSDERGILKSAYSHQVAVFVPSFVDSEIANDLYVHNRRREKEGRLPILVDLEQDSKKLLELMVNAKRTGIFSIGGGVPRNNVQNVAPLLEILNPRLGLNLPIRKFQYGCRICPDPMWYGHLSGCTYSEGVSWRKMDPFGKFTEIKADATLVLPFLVRYVLEGRE